MTADELEYVENLEARVRRYRRRIKTLNEAPLFALVVKWRRRPDDHEDDAVRAVYECCASELERLLQPK